MVQVVLDYLNIWERLRSITLDDSIPDKGTVEMDGRSLFLHGFSIQSIFYWTVRDPWNKNSMEV